MDCGVVGLGWAFWGLEHAETSVNVVVGADVGAAFDVVLAGWQVQMSLQLYMMIFPIYLRQLYKLYFILFPIILNNNNNQSFLFIFHHKIIFLSIVKLLALYNKIQFLFPIISNIIKSIKLLFLEPKLNDIYAIIVSLQLFVMYLMDLFHHFYAFDFCF